MRVIAIARAKLEPAPAAGVAVAVAGTGTGTDPVPASEASGRVPKRDLPLVRRDFLKGSGVLMGTLA